MGKPCKKKEYDEAFVAVFRNAISSYKVQAKGPFGKWVDHASLIGVFKDPDSEQILSYRLSIGKEGFADEPEEDDDDDE